MQKDSGQGLGGPACTSQELRYLMLTASRLRNLEYVAQREARGTGFLQSTWGAIRGLKESRWDSVLTSGLTESSAALMCRIGHGSRASCRAPAWRTWMPNLGAVEAAKAQRGGRLLPGSQLCRIKSASWFVRTASCA